MIPYGSTNHDGDHRILGGTILTLIGCILVKVIYAITAMLFSDNPDTLNRHDSIESTAKYKPRRQGIRNIAT